MELTVLLFFIHNLHCLIKGNILYKFYITGFHCINIFISFSFKAAVIAGKLGLQDHFTVEEVIKKNRQKIAPISSFLIVS